MLEDSPKSSAEAESRDPSAAHTAVVRAPSAEVGPPGGEPAPSSGAVAKAEESGTALARPQPAQPPAPPAAAVAAPPKKKGKGRIVLLLVAAAVIGGGGFYGYDWWTNGRFLISTDDAYIGADMAVISPKVTGYVLSVPVVENQHVKAGDPIAVIDPGDFQLAVDSAEAKIATQQSTVSRIEAQRAAAVEQVRQSEASRESANASLDAANATLAQAEQALQRAQDLVRTHVGTQANLDQAKAGRDTAAAQVTGAKASISSAEAAIAAAQANVGVLDAQEKEAQSSIRELEIARDSAKRDLSFTTLTAPYDGIVGNLSVQQGDLVSAGKRLAAIVPADKLYIDANFKETDLADIHLGQKVEVDVDAMPGRSFEGRVSSIAPASGAVFSLIPADNATGNFTKVVQRVPVRIAIDDADVKAGRLRPGLSVVVAVDTRTTPTDAVAQNGVFTVSDASR
ncbi:HlyD family secretion protein [Mangrovibrevibacter kandeliae]|uniref:HlyD family secretion protein n=1 Tax=Mangrovibrevibacter kandeliae TaxID=2968473 RepID=UPI0021194F2C|nr:MULTISPECIES: HlyD family secretion protein [unclassified Aurantimonas]MCQ8783612.1 HlyD family secretion protein [Aurantimonas sp. CSK15Z-1]MCW4116427.1 HlyD family secretion protein [Aurantimonas sp. MSK8Z-1]